MTNDFIPDERQLAARVPILSSASARALELDRFVGVLATFTSCDLGRERVEQLEPTTSLHEIRDRQAYYRDVVAALEHGALVPSLEAPIQPLLHQLSAGARGWSGAQLVELRSVLAVTENLRVAVEGRDPSSVLRRELDELMAGEAELEKTCEGLLRQLEQQLDERGGVKDDATPLLRRVRRQLRQSRDRLYSQLGSFARENADNLAEDTVTFRDGRLAVLIPAGSRGRLPGMVRGRSGRGNSFYFEPAISVAGNDKLEELASEDAAERQRILAELIGAAIELSPSIAARVRWMSKVDQWQAVARFSQQADCELPTVDDGMPLQLTAARHPLLDPRLADARHRALGVAGNRGDVVPLDLLLEDEGLLVITGPNAGGKTVALKTVGLLTLLAHCGLPIPVQSARVPRFNQVVAVIGDQQDLLEDRSTFSAKLHHLREVWEGGPRDRLVLLDEIGSGTGPEEGTALAIAVLQGLLEERAVSVLTTHLTQVAVAALESDWGACAAMGLDSETQEPTFRLRMGPPAASEALALASRMGLPPSWQQRAEEYLGSEHRELRQVIRRVEEVRRELEERIEGQREAEAEAAAAAARLEREREALEAVRKQSSRQLKVRLDELSRENRRRLDQEIARLRAQGGRRAGGRSSANLSQALVREARDIESHHGSITAPAPPAEAPVVGDAVKHTGLGWEGTLEAHDGKKATVRVKGKKVRVPLAELQRTARRESPRRLAPRTPVASVEMELKLIGERVEPALEKLDAYLDQAVLAGVDRVRVVHGHGTGRLREAVREHLEAHPSVASARPCAPNLGGNGATDVRFRT